MEKNKDFSCVPGECELNKISNELEDIVFKHCEDYLHLKLTEKFPQVHKGCLQKMYAEILQQTGSYLLGELYAHTIIKNKKIDEVLHD